MNKLDVGFIVDSSIVFDGDSWTKEPLPGSELAVTHIARWLSEAGHNVSVLCPTKQMRKFRDVTYAPLSYRNAYHFDVIVHARSYWRDICSLKKTHSRNILWAQDTFPEIMSLAKNSSVNELQKRLLQYDALVFASQWQRAQVLRLSGLHNHSILACVMYQPIPSAPSPQQKIMGSLIHTAHPRKAVTHVLRSFRILRDRLGFEGHLTLTGHCEIYQEIQVVLNGRPVTLAILVDEILEGNHQNCAVVPRALPQKELIQLVATAEILLHPDTSVETGATTVLEAMSVGTVPIVSDLGCLPELCYTRGLIVPYGPRFGERLAGVVKRLSTDKQSLSSLSSACRNFVHTHCGMGPLTRQWSELLDAVSSGRGRRGSDRPSLARQPLSTDFTVLPMQEISAKSWKELLSSSPDASVTHTPLWCQQIEGGEGTKNVGFGITDSSGHLKCIWPLYFTLLGGRRCVVSGFLERSGPCIVPDLDPSSADEVIELSLSTIKEIAQRKRAEEILLRFGHRHHYLDTIISLMRLSGYGLERTGVYVMQFQQEISPWRTLSRRLRTQIKRARHTCRVDIVRSQNDFSLAFSLYQEFAESYGYCRSITEKVLRNVWQGNSEVTIRLYLGLHREKPSGFAIVFRLKRRDLLFAWGSTAEVLMSGLPKLLVFEAIQGSYSSQALEIEYGGYMGASGSHAGLDEFYRRFGGSLKQTVQAGKMLAPADSLHITYKVI